MFQEESKVVVQRQVLEKSATSCQYLSNHNGARGFSGLGYFSAPKLLPYSGWNTFDHLSDDYKDISENFSAL